MEIKFFILLPDGMTTSAPSVGAVKLFSGELVQKEALDHRLERDTCSTKSILGLGDNNNSFQLPKSKEIQMFLNI